MNLPLFIAKRIYSDQGDRRKVSRPAIRIATAGVAVGLAVMIITVAVVLGFKHTIRDKVIGFGSHIQVHNILSLSNTSEAYGVCVDDSLTRVLQAIPGVRHVQRYAYTQGILKTDEDFLGILFKGVGPEFDRDFIEQCMVEGELPAFSDSTTKYKMVVSQMIADKLQLKTGDRVFAYFIDSDGVRTRKFTVSGIYQTNMTRFDSQLCFTDLYAVNKLNGWFEDQCSGAELLVEDFDRIEDMEMEVVNTVNRTQDRYLQTLTSKTIHDAYPQVFSWLELLDINVWIILGLMICLAVITMITGLLIIILERTSMIGTLKALGARNKSIRHTFLWFAAFVISQGLLIGDIVGIGIVLLQKYTGIVTLDPQTYYVTEAPMELNLPIIVLLNIATLFVSIFVLIIPTFFISHIHPAKSMRYE
jgi:lipoprotein-releasing system permease protein